MGQVANTVVSNDLVGDREDLADAIYNITPEETPFLSGAGRGKASNTLFEWLTDTLAAAATNAQVEGDDFAFSAQGQPSRVANTTQISRKTILVSKTVEIINKAGRKSELAYLTAKASKELKRDMEYILVGTSQAADLATGSTARKTGTILTWIRTNDTFGAGGVSPVAPNPTPGTTRVDGTQRAFTEALLKEGIQLGWSNGMDVGECVLMVNSFQKQAVSGFAGIATRYKDVPKGQATIVGAADIYVSDFGTITVSPNRHMRTRDALLLDFEYIEVAYLRPFERMSVAPTGDASKKAMVTEYGLKIKNEAALGGIFDLTTS
jgi:hypothetical protein